MYRDVMGLSVAKPTCVTRPGCGVMADVHYWADSGAGNVVLQRCVSSNISFVTLTYVQGVSQQPVRSQRDKSSKSDNYRRDRREIDRFLFQCYTTCP